MSYNLDGEEQELLDSIGKGEWRSNSSSEKLNKFKEYAKHSLNKDKRINIRISDRDLELLKTKALFEGIPYQTLISSILHKYVNNYN